MAAIPAAVVIISVTYPYRLVLDPVVTVEVRRSRRSTCFTAAAGIRTHNRLASDACLVWTRFETTLIDCWSALTAVVPPCGRAASCTPARASPSSGRSRCSSTSCGRGTDIVARKLRADDRGYYTISSAGHEHNAIVGALLRPTDPAFLHYRSGPFVMARARQSPGTDPVGDTVLSLMAAADEPVSGGRHKVWGSRDQWIVPQTSTIASHVPKATGFAFAHELAASDDLGTDLPDDTIVCCSFRGRLGEPRERAVGDQRRTVRLPSGRRRAGAVRL